MKKSKRNRKYDTINHKPKYDKYKNFLTQREKVKQEEIKKFGKEHILNQNRFTNYVEKTRMMNEQKKAIKLVIDSITQNKIINSKSPHSLTNKISEYGKTLGRNLIEDDKKKIMKAYKIAKIESLKTKLFQILGSKMCSICNSKNEHKLGFRHIQVKNSFVIVPNLTWDRYIDEPEFARKNLQVICLNCNAIKEPKHKLKKSKTPKKKNTLRTSHTWAQG
jgi:hypothetical protein